MSTPADSIPQEESALHIGRRERMLSTMLSSIDDLAYIFDREARLLFANRPLLTLWGKTLEETVGRTFLEMGYPPDLARIFDGQVREVVGTRRRVVDETLFTGADGSTGRFEYVFSPAFSADGSVDFVVGSARDISARKRAELALQESAAEFRNLAEAMPQIVWVARPDGWNTYINQQWIDYAGGTFEESLGKGWSAAFHPQDKLRCWNAWQAATENGSHYSIECRLRRADGAYRWWLVRGIPQRDAAGAVVKWYGTCTDIDDLKHAELEITRSNAALQQQRAEHRALFDLMPAMIWFKDTENRILRVNQRVADAAGLSIDEIEGRPSAEIYPREAAGFYAADLEVIRSCRARLGMIELLHDPLGEDRWVQTDKVPYFDDEGKVIGIVVMSQDVTERKRAEKELEVSHSELREVSRRAGMSEVATNVLHNVGNVLNSVNVSASLMVETLDGTAAKRMGDVVALMREHDGDLGTYITEDPKGKHIPAVLQMLSRDWSAQTQALRHELASLRGNIEHIKQIVAMQQGYAKVAGNSETLVIADLIEAALSVKQDALDQDAVRVIREFGDVPPINVEKHRVLQILVNLIRNAEVACNEQRDADKRITVRTALVDGRLRISITDNGSGIAAENLTRIFAHGFTTRRDGHGFGLHSGALAAAELGGSLAAASDGPGRGATFTLDLPLQPAKAQP